MSTARVVASGLVLAAGAVWVAVLLPGAVPIGGEPTVCQAHAELESALETSTVPGLAVVRSRAAALADALDDGTGSSAELAGVSAQIETLLAGHQSTADDLRDVVAPVAAACATAAVE